MRVEHFESIKKENTLLSQREIAKRTGDNMSVLRAAKEINEYLKQDNAEKNKASFKIQKQKREILHELKRRITNLKFEEVLPYEWSPEWIKVSYRDETLLATHDGQEYPITVGDFLYDHIWGITYDPDLSSVPHYLVKQMFVAKARTELERLLHKQVTVHTSLAKSDLKDSFEDEGAKGFWLEKIATVALKKLIVDYNPKFLLSAHEGDPVQDRRWRTDLVLKIRGTSGNTVVGIDLTTGSRNKKIQQRRDRVPFENPKPQRLPYVDSDGVGESKIVSIRNFPYLDIWNWLKDKKPGGADKAIGKTFQRKLLREIFKAAEIDKDTVDIFLEKAGLGQEAVDKDYSESMYSFEQLREKITEYRADPQIRDNLKRHTPGGRPKGIQPGDGYTFFHKRDSRVNPVPHLLDEHFSYEKFWEETRPK